MDISLNKCNSLDLRKNVTGCIQQLINKVAATGGGKVTIPSGKYLVNSIQLLSNVNLYLEPGAVLIGSGDENHYYHRDGPFELIKNQTPLSSLIYAVNQKNISITGEGIIDGNFHQFILPNQGSNPHLKTFKYPRPMMIYFENCRNVMITNIKLQNSPFWTIHLVGDLNTEIANIKVKNEVRMPNTDGIDIDRSKNTYIHHCEFLTGDDAICPKCTEETAKYGDVKNLQVNDCRILTQSSAVKFGSSSFGNFSNCYFENLTINDTNRGLAFQLRDPGSANNIIFKNIDIKTKHYSKEWWGAGEPIYITLLPRDPKTNLNHQAIKNVIFEQIRCDAENGILLASDKQSKIVDITFKDLVMHLRRNRGDQVNYDLRPGENLSKTTAPLTAVKQQGNVSFYAQNSVIEYANHTKEGL